MAKVKKSGRITLRVGQVHEMWRDTTYHSPGPRLYLGLERPGPVGPEPCPGQLTPGASGGRHTSYIEGLAAQTRSPAGAAWACH
jgi:hypothetical protein